MNSGFQLNAGFYGITDRKIAERRNQSLAEQAWKLCEGGAIAIQLRDKLSSDEDFRNYAKKILEVTSRFSVPLIINDRVEIALEMRLALHLGQDDFDEDLLKKLRKNNVAFGISTHSVEQALLAENLGASYVGIGPVFSTPTKPDYQDIGFDIAEKVNRLLKIPCVVIGGLDENHCFEIRERGFRNAAMVRSSLDRNDIADFVQEVNSFLI